MNSTPPSPHGFFLLIPLTQQPSKYKIIECTFAHTSSCPITISSQLFHHIICLVYKNEMTLDTFLLSLSTPKCMHICMALG